MKILSLETSTKSFSVALSDKGKVRVARTVKLKGVLSSSIIPTIEGVLKKAKVSLSSVDGFAIGLGPGSFTSLRVGLSTVKGFAFALKKPVVGISSLDVLAMNVPEDGKAQICTLCDARRNLLYWSLFEKKKGCLVKKEKYHLTDVDTLIKKVKRNTVFVGDGVALYKDKIKAHNKGAVFADEKLWYPNAKNLASLALQRFKAKKTDNIDKLVPMYLYPEDCQVSGAYNLNFLDSVTRNPAQYRNLYIF